MGNRPSRRHAGHLVAALAVVLAFGATNASASGRAPSAAEAATEVVTGSFAGKLDDAQVAVAVIAGAPPAEGQPRTISMYACNGTSIAVWLTGTTTGNSATLRSADGRFGAQVRVTTSRAGGTLTIPDGSTHRFVAPKVTLTSGLFDVTLAQSGVLQGRSTTGATLNGRVGATGALTAKGAVAASASAGGTVVKLTMLGRHLTPGTYRWIVLADGKVYGANRRGPGAGGIGGINPSLVSGPKVAAMKASSAGIKGWNNARCQGLADKWGKLVESAAKDLDNGNDASGHAKLDKAQGMLNTLESKCLTSGLSS